MSPPSSSATTGRDRPVPRRERARAATIEEIKQTALSLMRASGTIEVRFTDIARAMDMTPPALYRYFADRDKLLNALITDAYDDLGRALAAARDSLPADDIAGRWLAGAMAYRRWANADPQVFALIFGLPVPGYAAPEDGPTSEAARRALSQLAQLFVEADRTGQLRPPLVREVDPAFAVCATAKNNDMHTALPPDTFQAMLIAWATLHGFTCLETYGHLNWLDAPARDALFHSQVRLSAETAGLPQG